MFSQQNKQNQNLTLRTDNKPKFKWLPLWSWAIHVLFKINANKNHISSLYSLVFYIGHKYLVLYFVSFVNDFLFSLFGCLIFYKYVCHDSRSELPRKDLPLDGLKASTWGGSFCLFFLRAHMMVKPPSCLPGVLQTPYSVLFQNSKITLTLLLFIEPEVLE